MSKITALLENNNMVINAQNVFGMEKVSLDCIPSPFINRNMYPPPTTKAHKKKILFFPKPVLLGLDLPHAY